MTHDWDIQQIDINNAFLMVIFKRMSIWPNQMTLLILPNPLMFANYIRLFTSLNKHDRLGLTS